MGAEDGGGDGVRLGDGGGDGSRLGDSGGDDAIFAGDGASAFFAGVAFVCAIPALPERNAVDDRAIASVVAFAAAARRVVASSTRAATSTGDVARKNRRKTAGPSGERFRPIGRMILRNFERCERRRGALCMRPTFHIDP
jgi:hypothetical protein